jgi:hypothetical protein
MIKKKRKSKAGKKKAAPKKRAARRNKKEAKNPAEVRKDLTKMVSAHAGAMTKAVIGEGERGQLGPVKFLLELANIFPPSTDENIASTEEESFAQTLLRRLDIPDHPVVADMYENEEMVIVPVKKVVQEESAGNASGDAAKSKAGDEETAEMAVGCE